MSNELKFEATFDGQRAKKDLKDLNKEIGNLGSSADKADKSLNDMFKTSNSTTNYKRQLKEISKQLTDLTINYRQLSAAEKASASGQEMSNKIKALTQQASIYQDAMMDVQQAIRASASDTAVWDAAVQGMGVLTGAAQSVVGIMGTLGGDTQKMVKALTAIKSIESVFTTMKRLQAAMQGQSAVMQLIKRLSNELVVVRSAEATSAGTLAAAEAGSTAAKVTGAAASETLAAGETVADVATKRLTVSTLALKAAIGGIAVAALVAGISLLSKEIKRYNDEVKRTTEMNNKLSAAAGDAVSKFMSLQAQWRALGDDDSRKKWASENANALKELGKAETDLAGIDKMFMEQSADYVKTLEARARAAAAGKMIEEAYIKMYEKGAKADTIQPGKIYTRKELRDAGFNNDEISFGNNVSTGIIKPGDFIRARRRIEKEAREEADKTAAGLSDIIKEAQKDISDNIKPLDITNNLAGSSNKTIKELQDELSKLTEGTSDWYLKRMELLKAEMKELSMTSDEYREKLQELTAVETVYNNLQKAGTEKIGSVKIKVPEVNLKPDDVKIDDSFKDSLKNKSRDYTVELDVLQAKFDKAEALENLSEQLNGISDAVSPIESIFSSLDSILGDSAGNFMKVGAAAASGIQGVLQAASAYAMLASTEAAASTGAIPFPGNIIALGSVVAAVLSMIAKISSAVKFAGGGIVGGNSYIGDKNIVRVNSGEMIINDYQQRRLWDFISTPTSLFNSDNTGSQQVEFYISGDALRGALRNGYYKNERV